MFKIKNLFASIGDKEILKGVNLEIKPGKVHAIMGPNGSGKSTLASTIMGKPSISVSKGSIKLEGKDVLAMGVNERSQAGIFLAFQYPVEVSGVPIESFLRVAFKNKTGRTLPPIKFREILQEKMKLLEMPIDFAKRSLNEGFSGGEKKKAEILQMALLQPKIAILDETDSGLDISALKTVAEGINRIKNSRMGIIVITHYPRILHFLNPNYVHVMVGGKIVKTGNFELAMEIEEKGYKNIISK